MTDIVAVGSSTRGLRLVRMPKDQAVWEPELGLPFMQLDEEGRSDLVLDWNRWRAERAKRAGIKASHRFRPKAVAGYAVMIVRGETPPHETTEELEDYGDALVFVDALEGAMSRKKAR